MRKLTLELRTDGHDVEASLSIQGEGLLAQASTSRDRLDNEVLTKLREGHRLADGERSSLGRILGSLACPGEVGHQLMDSLQMGPVSLSLKVDQTLERVPWEFANVSNTYLAQHPGLRLSREGSPAMCEPTGDEVRILVIAADPRSNAYAALHGVEKEFKSVCGTLAASKRIDLTGIEHCTPSALSRHLKEHRCDVVHFIGHGDLKPTGGVLVLEGGQPNQDALLYGEQLIPSLKASGAKMVVLSGCLTGGFSSAIGSQLSKAGIPIVLGMQFPVGDSAAQQFARALYASLGDGFSIGEAVYDGRMAISGFGQDWAAPVLITSTPEACLLAAKRSTRGKLPSPPTSFIGRSKEIKEVVELMDHHRFVTLLGSGGIGKTRLSTEIGRELIPKFKNGVWLVLLESVTDPSLVMETIGKPFGIRASADQTAEERLLEFLADQNLLLILDNCEHLVPSCRAAVNKILAGCPHVNLLASSREVLGTAADFVVRIPPLSYPKIPEEDPKFPLPDTLDDNEAVQLFEHRAVSARSTFKVDENNVEAVCRIVKRLDGIPLAIELAASRIRTLSPKQILEKLTKDLAWLDVENPNNVPRHKTLRATLDWSYDLLAEKERTLFNRLGSFSGTFSLEAAEDVAGWDPLSGPDVIGHLANLVDKSLVVADEIYGEMRYRLLDTCRHYAIERLEATGALKLARDRHLALMGDFGARGRLGIRDDWTGWRNAFDLENDNVRAALDWGLSSGSGPASAHLACNVFAFWLQLGQLAEARSYYDRIRNILDEESLSLQIGVATYSGALAVYMGDRAGVEIMKEAHDRAERDCQEMLFLTKHLLGDILYVLGDESSAETLLEGALSLVHAEGDSRKEGFMRLDLGTIAVNRGEFGLAREHFSRMLENKTSEADIRGIGAAYCHLGHMQLVEGLESPADSYRKGIRALASGPDFYFLAGNLAAASTVLAKGGDHTVAATIQGYSDRLVEEMAVTPDRLVVKLSGDAKRRSREALGDSRYELAHKDGRTIGLDEALKLLGCAPDEPKITPTGIPGRSL